MTDTTKAQQWWRRLAEECEQPFVAIRYFDHLHDLADCAYQRAEEVGLLLAEWETVAKRLDALEAAHNTADATTPREDAATGVARDTSSAAEPFVDALCREYARRGGDADESGFRFYAQGMYAVLTDSPGTCSDQDPVMLKRAAAAPTPTPAPTRTISRDRLDKARSVATNRATIGTRGWALAFLGALGIEVEP